MKKIFFLVTLLTVALFSSSQSNQSFDIVVKGGTLIDPKNGIHALMDIAISQGKIAKVAASIDPKEAKQVVDARGLMVTPGIIDLHGHVFHGTQLNHYLSDGMAALAPDGFTFRNGVTTIVDCGGAGWRNIQTFRRNVIDSAQTRVLAFLNIVGGGMQGGDVEQNLSDMDPEKAVKAAKENSDVVIGFKLAHFLGGNWTPTEKAVEAGKMAGLPVMIDFGRQVPNLSIEELFMKKLRPGDIYTHTYASLEGTREPIVDEKTKTLKPFVQPAQQRGIIFDVGYGGSSFNFEQAIPALKAGLFPNTISTDLHTGSMNTSMKNILDVMSKFLLMGMPLDKVVHATTWAPAKVINRTELGHLTVGAPADISILRMRQGDFGFYDKTGYKLKGKERLECEVTIRDGKVVYDLNGLANPIYVN
jgi:dihydroorotase